MTKALYWGALYWGRSRVEGIDLGSGFGGEGDVQVSRRLATRAQESALQHKP